jgi:hypothetical protein
MRWIDIEKEIPKIGVFVLGYNKKWVDEENITGIRICFLNEDVDFDQGVGNWTSSRWSDFNMEFQTDTESEPSHWISLKFSIDSQYYTIEFIKWYSGMEKKQIQNAYARWQRESNP